MIGYRPRAVREKLGAGWAIGMGLLDVRVWRGTTLDVIDKPGSGKPAAAAFATLQRVFADQFIPDLHRAYIFNIVHLDRVSGTYIGTSAASNAAIRQLTAWQQAMLDGADYSIISTDIDGVIVSFNKGKWVQPRIIVSGDPPAASSR